MKQHVHKKLLSSVACQMASNITFIFLTFRKHNGVPKQSSRSQREHRKNVISYVTVGDSDGEDNTSPKNRQRHNVQQQQQPTLVQPQQGHIKNEPVQNQ